MRTVLPWALAMAVMTVVGLAVVYLMLVGVAWVFLQPFVEALEVMAMGEC